LWVVANAQSPIHIPHATATGTVQKEEHALDLVFGFESSTSFGVVQQQAAVQYVVWRMRR